MVNNDRPAHQLYMPSLNSTEDGSLDGDPKIYFVHLFYYS